VGDFVESFLKVSRYYAQGCPCGVCLGDGISLSSKAGIFSVYLFKIGSIRRNTHVSTCFQLHDVRKIFCGNLV